MTITGEVEFGILFGATAVLLDEATARQLYAPDGTVPSITVTAEKGVTQSTLRDAIAEALPTSAEAVTGAEVEADNEGAVQQGLGFFTTFLLVFAGVALFVGAFIIVNTFSMLIGQRARELALLASTGGLAQPGAGLGARRSGPRRRVRRRPRNRAWRAHRAGREGRHQVGARCRHRQSASQSPCRTVVISLAVGSLVTVAAAVLPARRAARIAPVAAMRGDAAGAPKGLLRRGTLGVALVALGGGMLALSVTRTSVPWPVGWCGWRRRRPGHAGRSAVGCPPDHPGHRLAVRLIVARRDRQAGTPKRTSGCHAEQRPPRVP